MQRAALLGLALLAVLSLTGWVETEPAQPAGPGDGPPAVRTAECRRAAGPIKIDGVLDDAAWKQAQVLTDFSVYWQKRKAKTATKARLLWDDEHLYFGAEM